MAAWHANRKSARVAGKNPTKTLLHIFVGLYLPA
jgi:hypothetical protein